MNEELVNSHCAHIRWVLGIENGKKPGYFTENIIRAFFYADRENFAKLQSVFPEIAEAYDRYMTGKMCKEDCKCEG